MNNGLYLLHEILLLQKDPALFNIVHEILLICSKTSNFLINFIILKEEGKLYIFSSKTDVLAIKIILANISQIQIAGKKLGKKIPTGQFIKLKSANIILMRKTKKLLEFLYSYF